MSIFAHVDGLGAVTEEAIADSVLKWRDEHCKRHQVADVLATEIEEVRSALALRSQGVAILSVTVKGRGFNNEAGYFFRLKRVSGGRWKRSASSI